MSDHTITWDHGDCDHAEDECTPYPHITCNAVGDGENLCRLQEVETEKRGYCESWSQCDYPENWHAMCPDFEHHDPGGQHCTYGHPIRRVNYCNVLEWLQEIEECGPGGVPHDGPIDVDWTGEGYAWFYTEDRSGSVDNTASQPL